MTTFYTINDNINHRICVGKPRLSARALRRAAKKHEADRVRIAIHCNTLRRQTSETR